MVTISIPKEEEESLIKPNDFINQNSTHKKKRVFIVTPIFNFLWEKFLEIFPSGQISMLYIVYLFFKTSYRIIQFYIPIIFFDIYPNSLFPFAVFQMITFGVSSLLIMKIGSIVDNSSRIKIAIILSFLFSLFGIIVCGLFGGLLIYEQNYFNVNGEGGGTQNSNYYWPFNLTLFNGWFSFFALLFLSLCNTVNEMVKIGLFIVIQKDWTVILLKSKKLKFEPVNAFMYSIDMFCNALCGLILGFLMKYNIFLSLIIISSFLIIAFIIETIFFIIIHLTTPSIQSKKDPNNGHNGHGSSSKFSKNPIIAYFQGLKKYLTQNITISSLCYVILTFTVLTPNDVLLTFLKFSGIDERIIGIFKTTCASMGFLASILNPIIISNFGLVRTALLSHFLHFSSLFFGSLIFFLVFLKFDDQLSIYIFMASLALARLFNWSVDIAQTQIMQLGISSDSRGFINSMEESFGFLAGTLIFIILLIVSDPHLFWILIIFSIIGTLISVILFFIWTYSKKGQLINNIDLQQRNARKLEKIQNEKASINNEEKKGTIIVTSDSAI